MSPDGLSLGTLRRSIPVGLPLGGSGRRQWLAFSAPRRLLIGHPANLLQEEEEGRRA